MRSQLLIIGMFLLYSCQSVKYIQPDQKLSPSQIQEDIEFVKTKLAEEHYDLDWENRKDIILNELDSLANSPSIVNVHSLKTALESVVNTIDDGHTKIVGIEKHTQKYNEINSQYCCTVLNENTVYLKIPTFTNRSKLNKSLEEFKRTVVASNANSVVIDLRNNRGGSTENVNALLKNTLQNETEICIEIKMKKKKGFKNALINKRLGFKRSGDYLVKKCELIKPEFKYNVLNKYLLVDSTIFSGSMIATYHLQKDGYKVLGKPPKSLFNAFGNAYTWSLPNSKLYINISTLKIHLNENFSSREMDMLIPDINIDAITLDQLIAFIEEENN